MQRLLSHNTEVRRDALRSAERQRFERLVLPHLDSAFNLARWLLKNTADAEEVVQEAMRRAYGAFQGFRGMAPKAWLLTIVHNSCYKWLDQREPWTRHELDQHSARLYAVALNHVTDGHRSLTLLLESLPTHCREVVVLYEVDRCSYAEIACITDVPIATVIYRLSQARERLHSHVVSNIIEAQRKNG